MKITILAILFSLALTFNTAPVCTIGSGQNAWSGSPADLATIEAVHQRTEAVEAGRAHPQGAPVPSPWTFLVTCSVA